LLSPGLWPAALSAQAPEICGPADFKTFINRYITLSPAEQRQCVAYPVTYYDDDGKKWKPPDEKALNKCLGDGRLVSGPEDVTEASQPFLSFERPDHEPNQDLQAGRTGYTIYKQDDGSMTLSMQTGGEFYTLGSITFRNIDGAWKLVEVGAGDG
jgi:hypothetical protein